MSQEHAKSNSVDPAYDAYLRSLPGLTINSYEPRAGTLRTKDVWALVTPLDATPTERIPIGLNESEILDRVLRRATPFCTATSGYLSVGTGARNPQWRMGPVWAKVDCDPSLMWLGDFWRGLGRPEFIFLSSNLKFGFGVTVEEDYYYLYLLALGEPG
jgi:hypothetical protein